MKPVAWAVKRKDDFLGCVRTFVQWGKVRPTHMEDEYEAVPLYTAPPAAPEAQEPERGVDTWDVGSAILNDALRWRNGDATDAEFIARMLFLSAKEHARTTASLAEFDDVPTVSAAGEEENDA